MSKTIKPVTSEIERVAHLFDGALVSFRLSLASVTPRNLFRFEAHAESLFLLNLIQRHIEAVITIARRDLVMLPAAITLTRAAFETGVRVLWLLNPSDPFEREVRWLAHLHEKERYYDRQATRLSAAGDADTSSIRNHRNAIRGFRLSIETKLPKKYKPLRRIPSLDEMMKSIGREGNYLSYMLMSQYAHGGQIATDLYKRNYGNEKVLGEFIEPSDWKFYLEVCWFCLCAPGLRFLERLGGEPSKFVTPQLDLIVRQALRRVA